LRRYIPENKTPHNHSCKNLKLCLISCTFNK
jgi:hypothetical protein